MTTATMDVMAGAAQALVDARLDTIDRMLLGRVARADRQAIVREVEAQIHELLGGRDPAGLDRDDVLAVLARLDPPEAYLSADEAGPAVLSAMRRQSSGPVAQSKPIVRSRAGLASGVLGLASHGLVIVSAIGWIVVTVLQSEAGALFLGAAAVASGLGLVTSLLAIVLAGYARLAETWSIVGLVTGILSFAVCGASLAMIALEFMGGL